MSLTATMVRTSLGALLTEVERQPDFSSEEVRELLASCEMGNLSLKRLWQLAQEVLDRGMECQRLTLLLTELMEVLDLGRQAFEVALRRLETADVSLLERAEGTKLFRQMCRDAIGRRQRVMDLLARLAGPPARIDPSALSRCRGDERAPGFIDLDRLTERLRSCQDA